MKTILLLSLITLFSNQCFSSVFNLVFPYHSSWTVMVNNHIYQTFGSTITIQGIRPGENFIRVHKNGRYRNILYQGTYFVPHHSTINARLDHFGNMQASIYTSNFVTGPNQAPRPVCHTPAPVIYPAFSVNELVQTIRNTPFDESRLIIMKQAIKGNQVFSEDVLQLMNELSFESSKLELAKFSAHYVTDLNRYHIINNGFTFSSSVSQLNQYLSQNFG